MKKIDTRAVDETLGRLTEARQKVCRGTAALERLRELLDRIDLDEEVGGCVHRLLAAALDFLYEGAAELEAVRPVVMTVVESCVLLQGALRRRLRAARREGQDEPPFPADRPARKKLRNKPRDGA